MVPLAAGPSGPQESKAESNSGLIYLGTTDHLLRFYRNDELLIGAVSHFVSDGLKADEPVLIVATEAHRAQLLTRLRSENCNVDAALTSGQLTLVDAEKTLHSIMADNRPDWSKFRATLGPVLDQCRVSRPTSRVRVFGEMVDLLWSAGNRPAALRLEELWNQLASEQLFTLLCAYAIGSFYRPGDGEMESIEKVRRQHSQVLADESMADRVRSLEMELDQRRDLEEALRQMLQRRAINAMALEEKSALNIEHFRLLVECVKDYAIFMLDPTGHVISWNVGAARIKGYLAEEILGQHFSRFYPPEEAGKCSMELEVAAREGRFEDEGWRVRKDGTQFWANVVITPMLDRSGTLVGFAKVTRDLSQRRQLEQEKIARAALEQHLAEQKRTEEMREQLIGIVGHDLRSPLASVALGAEMMLKRGKLALADARIAARITRSADRMTRIISQLLDFTRARLGGAIPIDPRPVDLAEICSEVIAEAETVQPDSTLDFRIEGDSRGVWDRVRLAQVVSNLITNAIQHGEPKGRVEVQLSNEGDGVVLRIHNCGTIAKELLPAIFEPLRTRSGRQKGEGLGLGLYICKEIIRAHQGTVGVESSEQAGTTFTVRLPRTARAEPLEKV